jgi:hypothetical protein
MEPMSKPKSQRLHFGFFKALETTPMRSKSKQSKSNGPFQTTRSKLLKKKNPLTRAFYRLSDSSQNLNLTTHTMNHENQTPPSQETPPTSYKKELWVAEEGFRGQWSLLGPTKKTLAEKFTTLFPKTSQQIKGFCMSASVQTFLSKIFPFDNLTPSPLGLNRSCRGYDHYSKEYLQDTWLDRQLYPCHQPDSLWQASSQPQKTVQSR